MAKMAAQGGAESGLQEIRDDLPTNSLRMKKASSAA